MNRDDDSQFLLYIEPKLEQKSVIPIEDEYTMIMRMAIHDGQLGTSNYSEPGKQAAIFSPGSGYKGRHTNCDGVYSSNQDILLPNGMITNNLAVHYLMWFRQAIPMSDWDKLKKLQQYYGRIQDQRFMSGNRM